jgi:hypothetical protein
VSSNGSPALDPEDYPTAVCENWWAVDDATPTIADYVERTPELSTLGAALNAVNMTDVLVGTELDPRALSARATLDVSHSLCALRSFARDSRGRSFSLPQATTPSSLC